MTAHAVYIIHNVHPITLQASSRALVVRRDNIPTSLSATIHLQRNHIFSVLKWETAVDNVFLFQIRLDNE